MLSRAVEPSPEFDAALAGLRERGEADFSKAEGIVREILDAVRKGGDAAVGRYAKRFENRTVPLLLKREYGGEAALAALPREARDALELAAKRIREFHDAERIFLHLEHGRAELSVGEDQGRSVGMRLRALDRVGVYAPGGKARYPSSVLMSAIPARVAGVREILLATPLANDESDRPVLAAAHLAGVTAIVDAGGAQAVAALAYGTESVPRVDKIVGPGNVYVACAKRLVYGAVAIDSIAGPSEILVVADASANPKHVAADLLSQAEHDEDAYPLLLTDHAPLVDAVARELEKQLDGLPRAAIARESLRRHGHALVVRDRDALARSADAIAPEHLALHVTQPDALLQRVASVGAAFVGPLTPEAAGDYLAGPSHVLPTGGAVRFGSPLGVHDFVARTSIIRYSADALRRDAAAICALARLEGLEAHARAVLVRTLTESEELRA